MEGRILLSTLSLIYFLLPATVQGDGMIKVRFKEFENKEGKAANGHCCDGRGKFCPGGCDHVFKICLDKPNGEKSVENCAYGMKQAEPIRNVNRIPFGSKINNLDNPLTFVFFEPLPAKVSVKVRIDDHDRFTEDDFVDFLEQRVDNLKRTPTKYTVSNRTTLEFEVFRECTHNFYGHDCSAFCQPAPRFKNQYLCDPETGNKICTSDWGGVDCSVRKET
uniref:Delta-like transmembrane protein 1 n=1 Tax=Platynereis dumerilii TaxID=6359 RepID=A0A1C6ZZW6_PLADU|nr:delta-like transmembrane protein 1 [Platynereis dumerilii]